MVMFAQKAKLFGLKKEEKRKGLHTCIMFWPGFAFPAVLFSPRLSLPVL